MNGFQDGDQVFLSFVTHHSYSDEAKGHVTPATVLAAEHGLVEVYGRARVLSAFEQVSSNEREAWQKCGEELENLARKLRVAAADCRAKAGHANYREVVA